jgi:hypothetical protein
MLDPGSMQFYEKAIQEAYDALMSVEGALSSLGDALEYEHWRLGGAVEAIHRHISVRLGVVTSSLIRSQLRAT